MMMWHGIRKCPPHTRAPQSAHLDGQKKCRPLGGEAAGWDVLRHEGKPEARGFRIYVLFRSDAKGLGTIEAVEAQGACDSGMRDLAGADVETRS